MPKRGTSSLQRTHYLKIIYTGGLNYVAGLPARDMTPDEWESYPEDLRTIGLANGIYEVVEAPEEQMEGET